MRGVLHVAVMLTYVYNGDNIVYMETKIDTNIFLKIYEQK